MRNGSVLLSSITELYIVVNMIKSPWNQFAYEYKYQLAMLT